MSFIKNEHLYTFGGISVDGKKGFKYADIIIGCDGNYQHAVFIKLQNFFTIMMDDYQTLPTIEIASKVLSVLCEADITGSVGEEIDKSKIKDLLSSLNVGQKYHKAGNYIVRTEEKSLPLKKSEFLLNDILPIDNITVCITNIGTRLQVSLNKENKHSLDKYDRLFFISANGETVFKELLCVKAYPDNDSLVLNLISEHEYFMKNSRIGGVQISGTPLWMMQVMEYSLNTGRDNPMEVIFEDHSISSGKKRFFFLFSIRGLKIENDVRFGLVTLSNESGIDKEREGEYIDMLSGSHDCYAQIAVVNDSLRLAVEEAEDMVNKAITLLQILLLDDSPRSFFNIKDTYRLWEIKAVSSPLNINEHFYVEDVIDTQQYAILNREKSTIAKPFTIDDEFSNLLNRDNVLEDFFYLGQNKVADDLLQAIIWLNTSRNARNLKEKVISLYNCVEFLVTGEKGTLLSQELHLAYGSEYDSSICEIKRVVDNIPNVELRDRINGIINSSFEGNASLQSKLEALVTRLPITFEAEDWALFSKLKKNRQKLIHNKKISIPITNQELNELFHLFSKLIIYKIIDLSNGGGK